MKEVHDVAMNVCAAVVEGKLVPQAEVVIIFTEPHYRVDGSEMQVHRHTGSIRLMMGPKRMRAMAAGLIAGAQLVEQELAAAVQGTVEEAKAKGESGPTESTEQPETEK